MNASKMIGLVASCGLFACATATEPTMSFEEFQAKVYQEPDGVFVLNGDETVETEAQLYDYYLAFLDDMAAIDDNDGIGSNQNPLIVNTVGGADDKWSASAAMNITYCVSQKDFGTRYSTVVNAMASATSAWEGTGARVNFTHVSSLDGNCTARTSGVVFNVGSVCTGQYVARAFFPSSSRRGRNVLIDCTAFGNLGSWTLTGVLRHELGHTLGFRHEHTRPEAGTCYENSSWRALTSYDSNSVMHYPQCNGTQKGDLVLTSMDVAGARSLYP
jgi:serralysin